MEEKNTVKKQKKVEKKEEVREIIVEKKSGFNYAEVIVIMIITLIIGGFVGYFISKIDNNRGSKPTEKIINKNEVPSKLNEFYNIYKMITSEYYEDIDDKELLEAGINGMLNYLGDDYSVYMDQDASKSFNEQVEGAYTGIGVEILTADDKTSILQVFSNSPAEEAGLKVGDVFLKVDGEDVSKKNASEISSMIRESKKDEVKVVVSRDGEEKEFALKIRKVNIDTVTTEIFENNNKKIGYIYVSIFSANTDSQFKEALLKLEKEGIDGLIIDVRGNSGGYLTTVTNMASLFLNKSKIIYQLDTKGVVEQVYSTSNENRKYPIAVLINKASASASEILAGALQESYGATIIGTNSFGKGTVQKAYSLESGATIKYTVQKWLTPKGNWINKVGITPDIKVELDEEYLKNPSNDTDKQLQAAIKELSK